MNFDMRFGRMLVVAAALGLACNDGDSLGVDGGGSGGSAGTTSTGQTGGSATGGNATGGSGSGGMTTGGSGGGGGIASGGSGGMGDTRCFDGTCNGICVANDEGGCASTWTCQDATAILCTADLAQFCDCNGQDFTSSSSCVTRAWAHRGTCAAGADCDRRKIQCRRVEPNCPDGYVPSVLGNCFGPCVRVDQCACNGPEECPDNNRYTCHNHSKRCGPYLQ